MPNNVETISAVLAALTTPPLSPLTDAQRRELAARSTLKEIPSLKVLYHQGDMAPPILLLTGTVKLYSETPQGKECLLHIVRPGSFIDVGCLMYKKGSPASAMTLKPSRAIFFDTARLLDVAIKNPEVCTNFLRILATRQRLFMNKIIGSQGKFSVSVRVASWLLHRAKMQHGATITLETNLTLLASQMGISRESLSRELSVLTNKGYILRKQKSIYLGDIKALEERALNAS